MKRFLNNNDYIGIVTEEALNQLIRGNEERLAQAEEAAESSILEYLTENYEVEKALAVGKHLKPYNSQITYPAGSHFYLGDKIYKATRTIKSRKAPTSTTYWQLVEEFVEPERVKPYSQQLSFVPGDFVHYAHETYCCLEYNGAEYNNIQVPGIIAWKKVDVCEWIVNLEYELWSVVSYQGLYYTLVGAEDIDWNLNPDENDAWGLIADYDSSYNEYELSLTEYVVLDDEVYCPVMNPNSDEPKEDFNITLEDPRNSNLKKHILRLAIYELYKLISPTNVSSARITDYETSIAWLRDAARLRINPQIPRKVADDHKPITDYAIATYARDYDPYKNPWHI
jgi:hypothetical protein